MSYEPNQEELESVSSLPSDDRYRYLIAKIADWEEVWSVAGGSGWALMCDDKGNELIPIWPSQTFASACCRNEWQDYEPRSIELDQWIEKWLPGMAHEGRGVAAFPLPKDKGVVVSPERLKHDLHEALQQYE